MRTQIVAEAESLKFLKALIELSAKFARRRISRGVQILICARQRMHRNQVSLVGQKINIDIADRFHVLNGGAQLDPRPAGHHQSFVPSVEEYHHGRRRGMVGELSWNQWRRRAGTPGESEENDGLRLAVLAKLNVRRLQIRDWLAFGVSRSNVERNQSVKR